MLFADVCAGFISSCYGEWWPPAFFGFLASIQRLVHLGVLVLLVYTCCEQGLGNVGVPPAGHALWA